MGLWFLPFPVVRTCGVRLSHVVYSGVSWSRDDSAYCGAPLTLRKCGNAGMRRRKEEKLGSYSSDTIDLKKLFFFRQDISLAWNFLIWLCQPASESQRSICLHLSTAGVAAHTTKPDFFLFFTWALGIKPRSLRQALHLLSHPPAPWLGLFSRSDCGKAHFQTYSGRIYLYPDSAILTLDWYWLAHGKSTGNLIYRS